MAILNNLTTNNIIITHTTTTDNLKLNNIPFLVLNYSTALNTSSSYVTAKQVANFYKGLLG